MNEVEFCASKIYVEIISEVSIISLLADVFHDMK